MSHFPLTSSYLCPGCNCIGDNSRCCAACGQYAIIALSTILDRAETVSVYEQERVIYGIESQLASADLARRK
jgi:hypothetical protein